MIFLRKNLVGKNLFFIFGGMNIHRTNRNEQYKQTDKLKNVELYQ